MGFERCHPAVNLIYFAAVLLGMITFQHPVFLAISFLSAFVYSIKRNGWKALVFNVILGTVSPIFFIINFVRMKANSKLIQQILAHQQQN